MSTDILLTGFVPFDGAASNESWEAVQVAVPLLRAEGISVEVRELPVEFHRAGPLLAEAVRELRPKVVIAVGLASGRTRIMPERTAVNVRDTRIPDNAGVSPVDEPVVAGGPVGYFSSLPIKAMVAAAEDAPAAVSQTAGTYVCNDVFYSLQHLLATDADLAGTRGGFVHVPSDEVIDVGTTGRELARMALAALRTEVDAAVSGGAEH
ncbi:pyroglutamyl-peptidase I [Brachybacterium saurashtrense]|uniref:Pyrrolidone-carboxylate peptidase n=1 Tax=Brachybacterium saurashtrense TaxID=556288 RepID=A0A345YSB1_9MICO|nr:pyroglutamyl-peptidase I [Brachybacterium saurashtrense]AXK46813.1 pyroglutamyl-peptidase I [Brachybacterium saurashtrense]RRR22528.1 pyroglutamyl-peptidase I [Brachybacterium saurashtrense]